MSSMTPINRPVQPRFNTGSGLRSPLDADDLTNAHKKNRVGSNSTFGLQIAVSKMQSEIAKLRRRVLTPPQPQSLTAIIPPFSFYQVKSNTPSVETWRVLQMADGIFGGRSFFNSQSKYVNLFNPESLGYPEGNYELRMAIANDLSIEFPFSQPTPLDPVYGQTVLADATDTVLFDPNTNQTCGQIVLNNSALDPTVPGSLSASFWLEIKDTVLDGGDPLSGYYARLMGRMWSNYGTSGRPTDAFPAHSNSIIPLCLVEVDPTEIFFNQLQTGNIVNNYPAFVAGSSLGQTFYRGDWTTNSLSGQYFYPGDLVTNGTISTGGHTWVKQFIRKTYGTTTTAPASGADWIALIT